MISTMWPAPLSLPKAMDRLNRQSRLWRGCSRSPKTHTWPYSPTGQPLSPGVTFPAELGLEFWKSYRTFKDCQKRDYDHRHRAQALTHVPNDTDVWIASGDLTSQSLVEWSLHQVHPNCMWLEPLLDKSDETGNILMSCQETTNWPTKSKHFAREPIMTIWDTDTSPEQIDQIYSGRGDVEWTLFLTLSICSLSPVITTLESSCQ